MPRKPRHYLANVPHYILLSGHNKQAIFFNEQDYQQFCHYLNMMMRKYHIAIHAYTLLDNQVHLLLSASDEEAIPRAIQYLNSCYVKYVNRCYERSGTLFQGRHKASIVDPDGYLIACMAYIETLYNRTCSEVNDAHTYPYCSYSANGYLEQEQQRSIEPQIAELITEIITPHPNYLRLGADKLNRQQYYQQLCIDEVDEPTIEFIEDNLKINFPIASPYFIRNLSFETQLLFSHSKRGRPRKQKKSLFGFMLSARNPLL
ncbi:transposase [Thalassotalea sp. Y01]|uniref:transposase n=1 Tax=Thalassotalea sp. Y01 TaxID=2729613 RepID=UPI00145D36AB|nr:transposase [Thalassotalea sp. Y01]NMP16548.1 hypothetical protein [Thalassotalea sp. Y01]